ncbi:MULTISPECIES: ferritin-like domain-containing protein [unclassified Amycolatopsis]|uniref:ferritin-like domain-containing protein n=1 Tax=unclassified Amycolatopsis TaxID=2618356 RepID=UPI002874DE52|nr:MULTISPECIES: ferritin-like domain-containing protein [unclassified Amycolatopsis]MDS0139653.1 ferritin-like domain-containing protein [Amycolatopsis sp. 505]MDS0145076.1 ferritin-like domain-containing protein [Amycolatopsis sp. CM201R]
MFGKRYTEQLIERSAENATDRRRFLKAAGAAGLGVAGAGALGTALSLGLGSAGATSQYGAQGGDAGKEAASDAAVLNFALNLEYLEANLYSFAAYGYGLNEKYVNGVGNLGKVSGGHGVKFKSEHTKQIVQEIAGDEVAHVNFLRKALDKAAVAQPEIDFQNSFTAAMQAAGVIQKGQTFDPFGSENNFLLAAYLFEDVGVSAYKGAAPLVNNKTFLDAAAGILAVEAYHAGIIRSALFERGLGDVTNKMSDARDSLDGKADDDEGVIKNGKANLVPADANGIAFGRSAERVLNIAYLNPDKVSSGGFYPRGLNGDIATSGAKEK